MDFIIKSLYEDPITVQVSPNLSLSYYKELLISNYAIKHNLNIVILNELKKCCYSNVYFMNSSRIILVDCEQPTSQFPSQRAR